jgi:hypothetical protein
VLIKIAIIMAIKFKVIERGLPALPELAGKSFKQGR